MNSNLTDLVNYRRFLTRTDECIKAYQFITAAAKLYPELKADVDLAYKQVAHIYDPAIYHTFYSEQMVEGQMDESRVFDDSAYLDRFRWVKPLLGKSVLDIGCGNGDFDLNLAKAGHEVTATNLYVPSTEKAAKRAEELGVEAKFLPINFMALETAPVDSVIFFEILEHVPDPGEAIKKCLSFVKPGGVVFISTPDGTADEEANVGGVDAPNLRGHVRVFTEDSLRELCGKYGEITDFYRSTTDSIKSLHLAIRKEAK